MRSRGARSLLSWLADTRRRLQRGWLNQPVRTKGLIVVAVPLLALTVTATAGLTLQHKEDQARAVAVAGNILSNTANLVLANAVNAETSVRGYVITGDPLMLQPYNLALTQLSTERTDLRDAAITAGDRRQERVVDASLGEVLSQLAGIRVAASSAIGPTPGLRRVVVAAKPAMDRLRRQVATLAARPTALALPRRAEITKLGRLINTVDIAGLIAGLLAGLAGVALFTSGISRRLAVAAANAVRLGEAQALEPVEASRDELGRLADSLVRAEELVAGRAARQFRLALLAAIVDSSDDAIVSRNTDGVITSWNPAAERIYGYPAAEIVGHHISLLREEERRSEEAKADARVLVSSNGSEDSRRETVQLRKDGTTFPASLTLSAIYDDDGALLGTSSIGRDITDQLRAAAELRSQLHDLEQANQNLETFTYSVSHDLRAPLRTLSGFSAALLEDYRDVLGEDGRDYAERIEAAAGRMALLIDDLLEMSRVWRTEIHDIHPVDLSAEVTAIAGDLQRTTPGRSVRLTIQDGVCAPADRVLIRTVLENLLGNAWKFTSSRDDASIEFGTIASDEAPVCCYVRDNGAGFDPAYASKLFQPFQRLHTTQEFPGTGIGLASVRQIIERHGGRVWAESTVGEGATFFFTLDAKETPLMEDLPDHSMEGDPR